MGCADVLSLHPRYLDKLTSCGYWSALLELYPTIPLSTETLDAWLPPTVLWIVPREFALHLAALAAFHLLSKKANAVRDDA